jgi:hypothetical protein
MFMMIMSNNFYLIPKHIYSVNLFIDYKPLKRVTHKFTRKGTRINCAKLRYVCYDRIYRFSKHLKDYFLDVKIDMV